MALFRGEDQRTETLEISDVDLEISVLQKESHDLSVAPDSCTGQGGIAVQVDDVDVNLREVQELRDGPRVTAGCSPDEPGGAVLVLDVDLQLGLP